MKVVISKWVLLEKSTKLETRLVALGCDEHDAPDELFLVVVNTTTVKTFVISYRLEGP